jgi:GNAT superfamily N-acetyltransferase
MREETIDSRVRNARVNWDFRSRYSLGDGTKVSLRLIRPDDSENLLAGFERLSPTTRYRRFFSATAGISETMLRYFTETDGWDHVAVCASVDSSAAEGFIGVARFIRVENTPDTAEAAVAVIDEMQGRGLGRLLLATLAVAARERGIKKFRAQVLPLNKPMTSLLKSLDEHAAPSLEDGLLVYELPLPEMPPEGIAEWAVYRLMKLAAEGVEIVFRTISGIGLSARSLERSLTQSLVGKKQR